MRKLKYDVIFNPVTRCNHSNFKGYVIKMPFLEYRCDDGHLQEIFFKSIKEGEHTPSIMCDVVGCNKVANKIFSVPIGFGLYGSGFYKGSATKRESTKTVSIKHGNSKIQ